MVEPHQSASAQWSHDEDCLELAVLLDCLKNKHLLELWIHVVPHQLHLFTGLPTQRRICTKSEISSISIQPSQDINYASVSGGKPKLQSVTFDSPSASSAVVLLQRLGEIDAFRYPAENCSILMRLAEGRERSASSHRRLMKSINTGEGVRDPRAAMVMHRCRRLAILFC